VNNMLIAMLVIDILALIILFFIKKKISEKKFNNIVQRIFTWFIIIILFYLGSKNRIYMLMLFGLISTLSFKEFLQFAYIKYDNELKLYNLTVNLIFYIGIYFKNIYILLILFVLVCLRFYKRGFIIFAFFITSYLIGTAILLKYLVKINYQILFIPFISLIGFIGDIFISYLKRRVNLKDSGTLLLGHGGILDRVDSLIFTAPIILLIFKL